MNGNNVLQALKEQATSVSGFSLFPVTIVDIKFQKPFQPIAKVQPLHTINEIILKT